MHINIVALVFSGMQQNPPCNCACARIAMGNIY